MAQPWDATQQPKRSLCAKWSRGTKITLLDGIRRNGTLKRKDKAIFKWPWNEDARTKQKQQTNENRAIWLVYRKDGNARGFWLVKRTLRWKNFMSKNFLDINRYFALTSYCNTIGQSNNAFSILGVIRVFFGWKMKSPCFNLLIHWLIKQYQTLISRSYENRSISCLSDVTSSFFQPFCFVCNPARCFLYHVIVTASRAKGP